MPEQAWVVIASVLGGLLTVLGRVPVEAWLLSRSARTQYRWTAYQRMAELLGGPKGQTLDAAMELHRRIKNLEAHMEYVRIGRASPWLQGPNGYYFKSFLYRLGRLVGWIEVVRRLLPFVDMSIPNAAQEREFVRHLYLVREAYCSTLLFADLDYDDNEEKAHIFAGTWSKIGSAMIQKVNESTFTVVTEDEFDAVYEKHEDAFSALVSILRGLDVVQPGNDWALRWARLKAIHYSCALLLAHFGSHLPAPFHSRADAERTLETLDLIDNDKKTKEVILRNLEKLQRSLEVIPK